MPGPAAKPTAKAAAHRGAQLGGEGIVQLYSNCIRLASENKVRSRVLEMHERVRAQLLPCSRRARAMSPVARERPPRRPSH